MSKELAESEYNLGVAYYFGEKVEQNFQLAAKHFGKAVEVDEHTESQYYLGLMFAAGRGVRRNDRYAAALFRKAAEKNHKFALYHYGMMLKDSRAGAKNLERAAQHIAASAKLHCVKAQYEYGCMLEEGMGVEKNLPEALKWYQKAALRRHPNAPEAIKRIESLGVVINNQEQQGPISESLTLNSEQEANPEAIVQANPQVPQVRRAIESPRSDVDSLLMAETTLEPILEEEPFYEKISMISEEIKKFIINPKLSTRHTSGESSQKLKVWDAFLNWAIEYSTKENGPSKAEVVGMMIQMSQMKRHWFNIFNAPHSVEELDKLLEQQDIACYRNNNLNYTAHDIKELSKIKNAADVEQFFQNRSLHNQPTMDLA